MSNLDPLEMLLDAARFIEQDKPEWAKAARAAVEGSRTGAPATRQYYYRVNDCEASESRDPACICWHDEGTGPLRDEPETIKSWRDKPMQAADERSEFEKAWKDRPWLAEDESGKDTAWRWWQAGRAAQPVRSAATSKQVSAFGMMKANGDLLPCAVAEEDAIYHMCAPMFDVSAEYVRTKLEAAGWHTVRVQISLDPAEPLARNNRQTGGPQS